MDKIYEWGCKAVTSCLILFPTHVRTTGDITNLKRGTLLFKSHNVSVIYMQLGVCNDVHFPKSNTDTR